MAGSAQRQKVYVQVTELCLLAKALRAASIPPESPAKARQINPRFTRKIVDRHIAGRILSRLLTAVEARVGALTSADALSVVEQGHGAPCRRTWHLRPVLGTEPARRRARSRTNRRRAGL